MRPSQGWGLWEVLGEVTSEGETDTLEFSLKSFCKVNDPSLIYPCGKMNFHIIGNPGYIYTTTQLHKY